ncbi:hypothetical protein ACH5RR_037555 [Cinchona calisaya]|uniref:Uncharacterized protein n=1 Tax=Cinchona calisaya TaxID=153742 RepID=A0ABD2Y6J6_9GENT
MAGHRGQEANDNAAQCDLRDIKMDELRKQLQKLQQQFECLQAINRDETQHGSEVGDEEEEINPLHSNDSDSLLIRLLLVVAKGIIIKTMA